MKKYFIITTVGTSIFSNFNKQKVKLAFDRKKEGRTVYGEGVAVENFEGANAEAYIKKQVSLSGLEERIEDFWLKGCKKNDDDWDWNNDDNANQHASAEITSILEIARKLKSKDKDSTIEVQLLATDTALSVSAAKLIKKFPFHDFGVKVRSFNEEQDFIPSLGVKPREGDSPDTFYDTGLQNLVDKLIGKEGLIKKAKKDNTTPVINFSGGYKAIIPILTIIAQLENIPMYYIYEESDHLMELGSLPVNFDWAEVERLHYYLTSKVLNQRDISDEIKNELKDRKLITNQNKPTPLGGLFRDYRDVMPDGGGTFGKFVELKLWEHFVKSPLPGYEKQLPKRGRTCFKNINTGEITEAIPTAEKGHNNHKRIEIDLTFYSEEDYAILESKSLSGINEVKPNLYIEGGRFFNNGKLPKLFILIFYKYEHEKLSSRKQQLKELKFKVMEGLKIPDFRVLYINLPFAKDQTRVNYQDFIDQPYLDLIDALKELNI
ncbi:MAG: hypothetical protein H6563_02635 [Lewinellaceae bacterium]|nr:hypothetical protein [Lewinellaceae bacterium]